jgi:hypothetical protein
VITILETEPCKVFKKKADSFFGEDGVPCGFPESVALTRTVCVHEHVYNMPTCQACAQRLIDVLKLPGIVLTCQPCKDAKDDRGHTCLVQAQLEWADGSPTTTIQKPRVV